MAKGDPLLVRGERHNGHMSVMVELGEGLELKDSMEGGEEVRIEWNEVYTSY